MADILHLIQIRAPRETVYQTIATSEGIRQWFSRDADVEARIGGSGELRFAGGQRVLRVGIAALEPATRIVWKVHSAAMPNWADTEIEFSMAADGGDTLLHFAHRGFAQADDLFAMSATIWASFLISLKQYLETGKGTPHPDDPLSRSPDVH